MTIPAGPSEVTATWLGSALEEQVSSVSVTAVGTGQTGATYRVVPIYRYPNGMPSSFIAKLPSQLPEVRERVALGYRAEYAFYTRAADTVAAPLPRVYDCQIGSNGAEFVLLMSDLHPAVQGDQIRGCDDRQARLAVTALAGLHGPRWCDPAWLSFDGVTMPKADADVARGMGELAHVALDATLSGLGNRINADQRQVLTDSADLVEKWLMIYPNRFCLLHGDFRLDNLMFSPDRSVVTIVDWQTITVGLPARDLAYFLGTSLEPAIRAESEHALVDLYYRRLIYHGVTNYTGGQCWIDYRLGMLQVPLITTFGYAFAAATDRGDEMVLAMLARGCRAIRHLDTLELIRTYG